MEEGATAHSAPWTKGGAVSFTPYYAAPEQLDPRFGPTGPWTDVYGFALVMGEVLSGKRPMRGPDVVSVIAQATNPTKRPTPRSLGVAVPEPVEAAFKKALALAPKARFPDMGAFWDALTRAASLGTSGRHPDGAAAAASWVSPQHTVPMTSVLGLSGAGHAPISATMEMNRADVVEQPPSPHLARLAPPTPGVPIPSGAPSSESEAACRHPKGLPTAAAKAPQMGAARREHPLGRRRSARLCLHDIRVCSVTRPSGLLGKAGSVLYNRAPMLRPWPAIGLLLVASCNHGSTRLAGHWRGVRAEGVPPTADDAANAFAGRMQLDVSGDTITVTAASGKQSDKYKVVSEDKSTTVITTAKDGAANPQTFTFVDDKTMRWQVVPGKAVVFNKE